MVASIRRPTQYIVALPCLITPCHCSGVRPALRLSAVCCVTVIGLINKKLRVDSGASLTCSPFLVAATPVPAPAPATEPMAAPLPPPASPPIIAPTAAPPPALTAVFLPSPLPCRDHWLVWTLYVLPFMESDVSSSVRDELPAKRPALFTSTTCPTTSAPEGITVSSLITMGAPSVA